MRLGRRGFVTITTTGEKHAYCASICAEKRKPGKQQILDIFFLILDILKALVHEQQYAHIQKWPHAISKEETATKELALIQGESIMLLVYSLIV